jgi:hypothetical protein
MLRELKAAIVLAAGGHQKFNSDIDSWPSECRARSWSIMMKLPRRNFLCPAAGAVALPAASARSHRQRRIGQGSHVCLSGLI